MKAKREKLCAGSFAAAVETPAMSRRYELRQTYVTIDPNRCIGSIVTYV